MTVERTRQLLGTKVSNLSDNEVLLLIQQTDESIDVFFSLSVKKAIAKHKERKIQ